MTLLDAKAVDMIDTPPKVDDIMLCGACGHPSKVTLLGLVYITEGEYDKLSSEEKKKLNFAQRVVKRELRA